MVYRFKDVWFENTTVELDDFEINEITEDEEQGLYIIENADGLFYACKSYDVIPEDDRNPELVF